MSKFEKLPEEGQGGPKFDIQKLPRANEEDVAPAGITYIRKKSFKELPLATQKEIVDGHISFDEAWEKHSGSMRGAYSVPFGPTVKRKIGEVYSAIENWGEASKEVLASLSSEEKRDFQNAVSLHVSAGRSVEDQDALNQPTLAGVANDLRIIRDHNRNFLSKTYNLKELSREAKRLVEEEHKKDTGEKYARDLTLFFEASAMDPGKIDFETQVVGDRSLERALREVFVGHTSSNWHRAFMTSAAISDEIKARILAKIKEYQDNEDREQGGRDPRHNGELTDSFLSTINPEKEPEQIGDSFSFDGMKYEIVQLFTRKQLKAESEVLEHCVGNTDTYFHAIREGRKNIFSVRSPDGTSRYTIAYDQKERSITQFRGEGNTSIDPTQEKSGFLLQVLNFLENAGFRVSALREDVNYSIVKKSGAITRGGEMSVGDTLRFLRSSPENRVIKSELLRIENDLPGQDLEFLSRAEGLALNFTEANMEAKRTLKVVKGDLVDHSRVIDYGSLEFVGGNANFVNVESASGLRSLVEIGGNANFMNLDDSKGLNNLMEIGGNANFLNLKDSSGLANLKSVGGNLNLNNLTKARGLQRLRGVGGYANFLNLEDSSGLETLYTIGGNVDFPNLHDAKKLNSLTRVGGNANFMNLEHAEGLNHLAEIGGHGVFINLESAQGLDNLERIKGNATFNRLREASGLGRLKKIGRNANFLSLRNAEGLKDLSEIGGNADFPSLQYSVGLGNLTRIGGNANFISLRDADGLRKLTMIGRHAFFYGLTRREMSKMKVFSE